MDSELTSQQKKSAAAIIAAQTCTRIGDVLTNPKTVLTWLLSQLGTSGFVIGMLVPIRESGSMLPQLFISSWVKRAGRRKWVFVGGAIAQALCVATMGLAALLLQATAAGIVILISVAAFSISRAFCSISSKDVLGRAIPKGFRGRVSGVSSTLSGLISAVAACVLILYREHETASLLAWIVLGAAVLWILGAGTYSLVFEPLPEKKAESKSVTADMRKRIALVVNDPLFRRFIIARGFLLGSALASPLLVVLSQTKEGTLMSLVGFLIAAALATSASSFLWGAMADKASHKAMAFGGLGCAFIGVIAICIANWLPELSRQFWLWPVIFFLFNLSYTGVRMGRKVWVVDAVDGDKRTDYVSASNTLIALMIIAMGLIASPLQSVSPLIPLGVYSVLCFVGTIIALGLKPEKEAQ
ncbi:MAG: MFS transporter [Akkermansiaceae bacterium]